MTQPAESEPTESSGTEGESSDSAESNGGTCKTSQLRARFYPETRADERVTLRLANVGGTSCTIEGYPELEFVGENGAPVQIRQQNNPAGPSVTPVALGTRQGVTSNLVWSVHNTDERFVGQDCPYPLQVRVTPPGNTEPIVLDWNHGAVCNGGSIEPSSFKAG